MTTDPDRSVPSPPWSPQTKIAMAVVLGIGVVWVAYIGRNALTFAALAGLVAYLLAPFVRFAHRRLHIPRVLALLGTYLFVFLMFLLLGGVMAVGIVNAVSDIEVADAEQSLRSTSIDFLESVREFEAMGYTVDLTEAVDPLLDELRTDPTESADATDDKRLILSASQARTAFGGITGSFTSVGSALLAAIMSAIITLLIAIYMSADSKKFHAALVANVPDGYEHDLDCMAKRVGGIWRGYLYGQLLNSLITGVMVGVVLWAVGLPGAFVFGVLMGLLNMIPTFGPILAAIPGVLVALALGSTRLDMGSVTFTLLVLAIYVVVVQLQANVIAPYITGRAVKLSPATVLLGLIVGVQVAGLVGAVLVVPVIGTGKELGRYVYSKLIDRPAYPLADNPCDDLPAEERLGAPEPEAAGGT